MSWTRDDSKINRSRGVFARDNDTGSSATVRLCDEEDTRTIAGQQQPPTPRITWCIQTD